MTTVDGWVNNRPTPPKWYQGANGRVYRTNGVPEFLQDSMSWNSREAREIREMLNRDTSYRGYGPARPIIPHRHTYRCRRCGAINYLD